MWLMAPSGLATRPLILSIPLSPPLLSLTWPIVYIIGSATRSPTIFTVRSHSLTPTRPMASTAVDRVDASLRPPLDVVDGTTPPYLHRFVVVTAIGYPTFSTAVNGS